MATIKDVAARSGVSVATVSRALSGSPSVSPETRIKVQRAAAELGYEPNLLGAALRMTKTKKILVIAPSLQTAALETVAEGIQWKAVSQDYDVLFSLTHHDPVLERRCLEQLNSRLWDGAILLSAKGEWEPLTRLATQIPVVQCLSYREELDTPVVSIDYRLATQDTVQTLCAMGHRRIALLTEGKESSAAVFRQTGYLQALRERGILPDQALIAECAESYDASRHITRELLSLSFPPTAILCHSDLVGLGALDQAKSMGLLSDVSVFGFGDTELSRHSDPPLSTVSLPLERIGQVAVELLFRKMENHNVPNRRVLLGHQLELRASARKK